MEFREFSDGEWGIGLWLKSKGILNKEDKDQDLLILDMTIFFCEDNTLLIKIQTKYIYISSKIYYLCIRGAGI